MPGDVSQRLLGDPVESYLDCERQAIAVALGPISSDLDIESAGPANSHLGGESFQGLLEASAFQRCGPQTEYGATRFFQG